jgi:hypothetical protein
MNLPDDPVERKAYINELLRLQNQQKAQRVEEMKVHVKEVPLAPELIKEVMWLGPDARESVLRNHPGCVVARKLESLWEMLAIFEKAHADLKEQLDGFDSFSSTDEMHRPAGRPRLRAVAIAVNKELVAFSAAAGSLVDFSRRLRKVQGLPDMGAMIASTFDAGEHAFVIALRNVICHEMFPDVGWQIEHGRGADRKTDFIIPPKSLGEEVDLAQPALAYAACSPNGIRVRELADSYSARVVRFYAWYRSQVEASPPAALSDFRRVTRACMANASRTWYRILLTQVLAKKVDPFEHLPKYLLPEHVDAALKLPLRSKEQVDFIIAKVDEYGACDDELRSMVYKLFDVTVHPSKPE